MTILFQDDFEGSLLGDWYYYITDNYTATSTNGGTVTLTTDQKYAGSQSLQCSWATGDVACGLNAHANVGQEFYCRTYIRWENGWDWPSSHKLMIFWGDSRNQRIGFYTFDGIGDSSAHGFGFYSEEVPVSGETVYIAATDTESFEVFEPEVDTWYCLEIYIKAHSTEGQYRIWIDGAELPLFNAGAFSAWWRTLYTPTQPTDINVGYADVDDIDISTQNNDEVSTKDIWFDNFVIADTYIGVLGGDVTTPYVDGHSPAEDAEDVDVDTTIVCHVKDDGDGVDSDTIVMTVNEVEVEPVITGTSADYTLTYTPDDSLEYSNEHTVTVDASDLAAIPNVMATETWSFTTVAESDTTPPAVSGHSPADGSLNISIGITISCHITDAGSGVDSSTIAVTVNGDSVTPDIDGDSDDYTVTVSPDTPLSNSTTYTMTVDADDVDGNSMDTETWSFTTVAAVEEEEEEEEESIWTATGDGSTTWTEHTAVVPKGGDDWEYYVEGDEWNTWTADRDSTPWRRKGSTTTTWTKKT